jgi:predicted enzyme related to lactoylglutathione lyase
VLASTTETDQRTGRPSAAGCINGGFFPRNPDRPDQYPSVVIAVENVQAAMDNVKAAGGTVLDQAMEIPGVGTYVSITDSEGNGVSLLQPLPPTGASI